MQYLLVEKVAAGKLAAGQIWTLESGVSVVILAVDGNRIFTRFTDQLFRRFESVVYIGEPFLEITPSLLRSYCGTLEHSDFMEILQSGEIEKLDWSVSDVIKAAEIEALYDTHRVGV